MINKPTSKDFDWNRSYHTRKWAIRYLEIIEKQKNSKAQIVMQSTGVYTVQQYENVLKIEYLE